MAKYLHGTVATTDDQTYTYADCKSWPEGERWELIQGDAYDMAPAPGSGHQRLSMHIGSKLFQYLEGKACQVFAAPFDVFFPEGDETEDQVDTVVQPDIVVICDRSKITEKGCWGAPDLIVEILSPSTAFKDETRKLQIYEKGGVKEYWIVNPGRPLIQVFTLCDGVYGKPTVYDQNDRLPSSVLQGFSLDLKTLFTV